ncbi:MAG: DoxX family protein [bacterium]|nr:DoxX family protein [bacterium]
MSVLAADSTPLWISQLLASSWLWILVRIVLTSAYWVGGLQKVLNWKGAVAECESFHLRPARLIAALTILVELGGSALIISGVLVWLGAGALGVFTLFATLIAFPFWTKSAAERTKMLNGFCEHLGLVAALALVAIVDALKTGM